MLAMMLLCSEGDDYEVVASLLYRALCCNGVFAEKCVFVAWIFTEKCVKSVRKILEKCGKHIKIP
jgi:hypothetical protein